MRRYSTCILMSLLMITTTLAGCFGIGSADNDADGSANQPPIIAAQAGSSMVPNPTNTSIATVPLWWDIFDLDGSITEMGLDIDQDGIIDILFTAASGAKYFDIPVAATKWHQTLISDTSGSSTVVYCQLNSHLTVDVIAADNGSGESTERIFVFMIGYTAQSAYMMELSYPGFIPQANYDWIQNSDGSGTCTPHTPPPIYQYSTTDHSDVADSGTADSLFVLQFTMAPVDLNWTDIHIQVIGEDGTPATCAVDAGEGNCKLVQYGSDPLTWEKSEIVHVTENGKAICAAAPCTLTVKITDLRNGVDLVGTTSVVVE